MSRSKGKKALIAIIAGAILIFVVFVIGLIAIIPQGRMGVSEDMAYEESGVAFPAMAPAPAPEEPAMERVESEGEQSFVTKDSNMAMRDDAAAPQATAVTDRKIIKSSYMALETIEFDRTINAIVGKATAMGGYVESSRVQGTSLRDRGMPPNRTANFQIRIPQDQFESFLSTVGDLGVVTIEQLFGEDITGQYIDTEARLRTLKTQEERLLTILARADKLTDIIEVERELSRIRFEIESHTGTLKIWDHLVAFSSVSIDVYEVDELIEVEVKPENWFDRLADAFENSLINLVVFAGNFVIFLVAALPYLVIFGLLAWAGLKIYNKKFKKTAIKGGDESEK